MRHIQNAAATVATLVLLAACSTQPVSQRPTEQIEERVEVPKEPPPIGIIGPNAEVDELDIPGGKLANRSMYFNFDSYVIRQEDKVVAENHSAYLGKNKRTVLIQGHTDERGGSEYNLALGQKRAEAVRKSMAALGVPEDRMEAVSLGKENPKAEGHTEEAWSQNRRADIIYK